MKTKTSPKTELLLHLLRYKIPAQEVPFHELLPLMEMYPQNTLCKDYPTETIHTWEGLDQNFNPIVLFAVTERV